MQWIQSIFSTPAGLVLAFLLVAALVVVAGIRLSLYGDALGERTGLGSGLIGLVFLAAVTSLPELVVSITSVLQNANLSTGADLATGNMLGSNVFNLLILALMALFMSSRFKPQEMKNLHTDSMLYGLFLLAIFSIAFALSRKIPLLLPGLGCSAFTLLLPLAYLVFLIREHRQHTAAEEPATLPEETLLAHQPAFRFYSILATLCAAIILGGIALSILGSRMALPPEQGGFGLEASFIGTLFLAISTSLPELVISFSGLRFGLLDMAVGNVLGSNMFNLLIIFAADVAMRKESLLAHASGKNWSSVALIFILTLLAALLLRTRKKAASIPIAALMLGIYFIAFIVLS